MSDEDIYASDWNIARTYLRTRFLRGTITEATQKDLKRALVILAHAGKNDPWPEDTENFRATITQLLQVKAAEELHRSSSLRSWIAILISILALIVSVWQAVKAHPATLEPPQQMSHQSAVVPAQQSPKK